eukprot:COSAG02_NODE_788_length_17190_cov_18.177403_3_plen_53_part_00
MVTSARVMTKARTGHTHACRVGRGRAFRGAARTETGGAGAGACAFESESITS